jgi:hypothetical protein
VNRTRDWRLFDHEQPVDVIGPLAGIFGHVGHPEGKRRKFGVPGD